MEDKVINKIAWEIAKRLDALLPKYWHIGLAKDKPGTYCFEVREMITEVLKEATNKDIKGLLKGRITPQRME